MARYKIKHITHYFYNTPVYDSINQIMLYPVQDYYQRMDYLNIKISGNPQIQTFTDKYQNILGIFNILEPHSQLNITSNIEVEVLPVPEPIINSSVEEQWQTIASYKSDFLLRDFLEIEEIESSESILNEVNTLLDYSQSPFENAKRFSSYIFNEFNYKQGVTSVETGVDIIWQMKAGVCQDFAHILLTMLRLVHIPARYVSGYICPKNHDLRGEGATHAWVEVFLPECGWIGLDPTNDCMASDRHVRLATGRYFSDCSPIKGIYKGSIEHRLEVTVIVENSESKTRSPRHSFFSDNQLDKPSFISYSKNTEETISTPSYIQMQIQMQQ